MTVTGLEYPSKSCFFGSQQKVIQMTSFKRDDSRCVTPAFHSKATSSFDSWILGSLILEGFSLPFQLFVFAISNTQFGNNTKAQLHLSFLECQIHPNTIKCISFTSINIQEKIENRLHTPKSMEFWWSCSCSKAMRSRRSAPAVSQPMRGQTSCTLHTIWAGQRLALSRIKTLTLVFPFR